MTDEEIINIINSYKYFKFKTIYNKLNKEQLEYILNRYNDTSTYKENIIRIYNHIDERPKCPICGNYCNLTNRNVYGKTCGSKYCHRKIISNEIKEKCIKEYGVNSILDIPHIKEKFKNTWKLHTKNQTENIINKRKQTCLERYGVDNKAKLNETKQKMFQTNLNKYGHICSAQGEEQKIKSKITCQKLYGTDFAAQSDIVKNKQYETKRENGTLGGPHSKQEDQSYKLLKEKYPDVIRQYRSELYPFNCDFYIPSLDLYIECNYYWTHGGKLYEGTTEDNKLLQHWKKHNTKGYNAAIYNWTYTDILKFNTAKENNLNYKVFYNLDELKKYIETQ